MIPITIDTRSLTEQFDMTSDEVEAFIDYVVKDITASYARKWESQAKENLKGTRQRYIENLKVIDTGRMTGAVVLDYSKDPVVRMVEEGASAFDMKDGFSKSDKIKTKKDGGWYLTIPFRVATPDAIGESGLFAFKMPQEVYDVVKGKEMNIPVSGGGKRSSGLKLDEVPSALRAPKSRAAVSNLKHETFDEYVHKSSSFEGLSKVQDRATGQNVYMNFRRVSDESDPNSWVHSGILAHNLSDKAMSDLESNMESELNDATNRSLSKLGFGG